MITQIDAAVNQNTKGGELAPAPVELTLFTKRGGPCTKRISLADGALFADGSACAISTGQAARVRVVELEGETPLAAIAGLLASMGSNQALCLGRLAEGVCDEPSVVTERRRKEHPKPSLISRTQQFLHYASNEPALMLIDFDRKGMPTEVAERVGSAGGAWNALVGAVPGLGNAGRISRASTSAGIFNAETGVSFPGSGGEHHYLLVADGSDIPRALTDLHDRAWLNGLGWYMIGGAGQLLDRSIVDRSVGSPERLVFEGPPVVIAPLAQDQNLRQPAIIEGGIIDTKILMPPLTKAERGKVNSLKEAERRRLLPEAATVRTKSDRALAEQISAEGGIQIETAFRFVRARHDGQLLPSIPLEFDDSEIGRATVGDILDDPSRYIGETLADPLEGIAYGRGKALVMQHEDGTAFIHSFAHGRTLYDLVMGAERLLRKIDAAPSQSVMDVFVAALPRSRLEPDELAQIRRTVASRAGVGAREIDARIKMADEACAKAEADRVAAAMPADPRVTFTVPALNAELTPVIQLIDEVLCAVKDEEPPMRNASGALCEIRVRSPMGLHELSPHEESPASVEERLPAPSEPGIYELDDGATVMAIEQHIRFTQTKQGVTTNVQLPAVFAHTYRTYNASALPRVFGVATAPLVTETGVLAANGLNSELGLVFRIDPLLRRVVPEGETISDEDAKEAYRFLKDEWLCDVSTDKEGKALIIAAALTLVERQLLPERPAFFITAGQRGGGKTTLTNMLSLAAYGRRASAASWSPNEEERRKAVFAHLRDGPAMVAWDNLPRGAPISCPTIEKALTSPTITDRILGLSEQICVPATTIQFFTGNNIVPSGDMASRSFIIRLEVDRPDPENRDFKHPDPLAWTIDHRAVILRSLYKLLIWNPYRRTAASMRPQAKTRFKTWWTLCGAPVEAASGIDLAKVLHARESEDAEVSAMAMLMGGLQETFGEHSFTAEEVAQLTSGFGDVDGAEGLRAVPVRTMLEDATGKSFPKGDLSASLVGKRLRMIVEKPVQVGARVLMIERTSDAKRGNTYKIRSR